MSSPLARINHPSQAISPRAERESPEAEARVVRLTQGVLGQEGSEEGVLPSLVNREVEPLVPLEPPSQGEQPPVEIPQGCSPEEAQARAAYQAQVLKEGRSVLKKLVLKVIALIQNLIHFFSYRPLSSLNCPEEIQEIEAGMRRPGNQNVRTQINVDLPRTHVSVNGVRLLNYDQLHGALMALHGEPLSGELLEQVSACCQQGVVARPFIEAFAQLQPRQLLQIPFVRDKYNLFISITKKGDQFVLNCRARHMLADARGNRIDSVFSNVLIKISPGPGGAADLNPRYSYFLEVPRFLK